MLGNLGTQVGLVHRVGPDFEKSVMNFWGVFYVLENEKHKLFY